MSFTGEFGFCLHGAGLPTPVEAFESAGEVLDFLDQLNQAAENAGGLEITLGALEAAGFAELGGLAADAAAVTVAAYAGACAGCLVAATGSTIFDALTASSVSQSVKDQVLAAADDAGLTDPDTATA